MFIRGQLDIIIIISYRFVNYTQLKATSESTSGAQCKRDTNRRNEHVHEINEQSLLICSRPGAAVAERSMAASLVVPVERRLLVHVDHLGPGLRVISAVGRELREFARLRDGQRAGEVLGLNLERELLQRRQLVHSSHLCAHA